MIYFTKASKNPLFIIEASKEDADKLEQKGKEESDLRKGSRIVNSVLNKPRKYRGFEMPQEIQDKYNKRYKIGDIEKFNQQKDKPRKTLIRDAVKKSEFIPSSDTDERAIKAYEKSKRYEDIDPEASIKGMSKEKADAVKRVLASGGNLPDSIRNRLVKKSEGINQDTADRHGSTYFRKTFSDDEKDIFDELKSLHQTMKKTNNYDEYKKAYDRFLKLTGYKDAPHIGQIDFQGNQLQFHLNSNEDETENAGDSEYYHTSSARDLKKLYPTFKSSDGVFYSTPRVYFNKDKPMAKTGFSSENDLNVYTAKFNKDLKVRKDSELNGNARYVETKRSIDVK